MLTNIFLSIMEITLFISPAILTLLILTPLLGKRYTAKCRTTLWMILSVRMVIPFNININHPVVEWEAPAEPISTTPLFNAFFGNGNLELYSETSALEPSTFFSSLSLTTIFAICWVVGFLTFFAYHLIKHLMSSCSIRKGCSFIVGGPITNIFHDVRMELGINKEITLCYANIDFPMMLGFFNTIIVLPRRDFSLDELYGILRHELLHYKRRDLWYKLLLLGANAINWFNPLAYAMVKQAGADLEIACDMDTLRGMDKQSRRMYGYTLLSIATNKRTETLMLSTQFCAGEKWLRLRFQDIMNRSPKKAGFVLLALLTAISVSMGFFVGCSLQAAAESPLVVHDTVSDSSEQPNVTEQADHVQFTYENGNQSIVIDAEVAIPAAEKMYRYRAEPLELDVTRIKNQLSHEYTIEDLGAKNSASTRLLLNNTKNTFHLLLKERRPYYYLGGGEMDLTLLPENIIDSRQAPNCDMTMDEATTLALQFNEKLGITGMTPQYVSVYRKYKLTEDGFPVEDMQDVDGFYHIYMLHTLDGIPLHECNGRLITPEEMELLVRQYADYFSIQYFIDKDGIQEMRGSAYSFTKIEDAENLITAQEAVQAVRNGIEELIRQYNTLPDEKDGAKHLRVSFEEVALEYMLDKLEDEITVEPIWHFYATGADQGYKDFYVNAITGELVIRG